ncbi:hypothetical protein [Myxococcus virescens]|nr:hypothetical protein [Myxococcus virescens]
MAPSRSASVHNNSNLQSVVSQVSAVVGRAEAPPVEPAPPGAGGGT